MKVYSVLLIIVLSLTTNIFSQVQFTPHTITGNAIGAVSVYAVDVDGDGDIDVLSASHGDNAEIAWYENDGNENFTPHTITRNAIWANSVYAIDVDGDGDMDVLSASANDNKIAWYENDGNENFTPHTITTSAAGAASVYAIDVDGDGDMDVLSASWRDAKIAWYENDGNENFTTHTITTSADGAFRIYAVDVDGDEDIDVLSASVFDGKIAWYENLSTVGIDNKDSPVVPVKLLLYNNYPNPFNPRTIIEYALPKSSEVSLVVYNLIGEVVTWLVADIQQAGQHKVTWDASDFSTGIYFYRLQAGDFVQTRKMLLLK